MGRTGSRYPLREDTEQLQSLRDETLGCAHLQVLLHLCGLRKGGLTTLISMPAKLKECAGSSPATTTTTCNNGQ